MSDIHYYISSQNGDDVNDGLTPMTAWATLLHAANQVISQPGGNAYIHIGPGVYRERFVTQSGLSGNESIIWAGDPHCVYLTNDKQGRVRITGCDSYEYPTNGAVLNWTNQFNAELWDVEVDGSDDFYACYNIPICRRVKVISISGFYAGNNYDCTAISSNNGFHTGNNYNCTAISSDNGFYEGDNYNCTAISGGDGFFKGRAYNCTAIGCQYGFNTSHANSCTTISCWNGFYRGSPYNCSVIGCRIGIDTSTKRGHTEVYCNTKSHNPGKHVSFITPTSLDVLDGYGLQRGTRMQFLSTSVSKTMDLRTTRNVSFNPVQASKSFGVAIYVAGKPVSGNVICKLMKNGVEQKSKSIDVINLVAGDWNTVVWDAGTGDDQLTTDVDMWSIEISADADGQSTILSGANSTVPSVWIHYYPDNIPDTDILGQKRTYGMPIAMSYDVPIVSLDSDVFQTNAPSIKFNGHGEKIFRLPVKADVAVTVTYQTRHDGALIGMEPQLKMRGLDITEKIDTHTAGANAWEALSVTSTPMVDGLLEVILVSRDKTKNVWFSDPIVS